MIKSVHTLSILSVELSDVECQEIPDKFPGTASGENCLVLLPKLLLVKIPDNVTLNLNGEKFPVKMPGTFNGASYPGLFSCGQNGMKFPIINLSYPQECMLGDDPVITHTQGSANHGSSYEIQQNGILGLAMSSRGSGTLLDLSTHLEQALLPFCKSR